MAWWKANVACRVLGSAPRHPMPHRCIIVKKAPDPLPYTRTPGSDHGLTTRRRPAATLLHTLSWHCRVKSRSCRRDGNEFCHLFTCYRAVMGCFSPAPAAGGFVSCRLMNQLSPKDHDRPARRRRSAPCRASRGGAEWSRTRCRSPSACARGATQPLGRNARVANLPVTSRHRDPWGDRRHAYVTAVP
jgi:hypothetical protein